MADNRGFLGNVVLGWFFQPLILGLTGIPVGLTGETDGEDLVFLGVEREEDSDISLS